MMAPTTWTTHSPAVFGLPKWNIATQCISPNDNRLPVSVAFPSYVVQRRHETGFAQALSSNQLTRSRSRRRQQPMAPNGLGR